MDAKRRQKKTRVPKPRAKEYTRRSTGQYVACTYILVATRDATEQDKVRSRKAFQKGDIRVGSSAHCYQRLNNHKRFGWIPIAIFTNRMEDATTRYKTERQFSRFFKSQISDGEEFDLINGDF